MYFMNISILVLFSAVERVEFKTFAIAYIYQIVHERTLKLLGIIFDNDLVLMLIPNPFVERLLRTKCCLSNKQISYICPKAPTSEFCRKISI